MNHERSWLEERKGAIKARRDVTQNLFSKQVSGTLVKREGKVRMMQAERALCNFTTKRRVNLGSTSEADWTLRGHETTEAKENTFCMSHSRAEALKCCVMSSP